MGVAVAAAEEMDQTYLCRKEREDDEGFLFSLIFRWESVSKFMSLE